MIISRKSYNIYDVYIFLLIASLVAGNLFGAFQIPRVLAILFLIPCTRCYPQCKFLISDMKNFALLFLLYSFLSCLWAPTATSESLLETGYNVVHMILFFEIIIFSRPAKNAINAIFAGFLVAFLISAVIAFWELTTDNHLYTSKIKEAKAKNLGYEIYMRYFAAVTFYNFNMYTTFLCFTIPFIFYGITNKNYKLIWRIVSVIAAVSSVILVLFNASRGGLLAIIIVTFVYYQMTFFKRRSMSFYAILFVFLLIFILYYYGSDILNTLMVRGSVQGAIENEGRLSIWHNAYKVAEQYLFLGCGAGGINNAMEQFAQGGITIPHNLFMELFSQYGLFFLCVFVVFVVKILRRSFIIKDNYRKITLYQSMLAFPIICIINSGYLTAPVLWAFMASLYVFANYERIKSFHKNIRRAA